MPGGDGVAWAIGEGMEAHMGRLSFILLPRDALGCAGPLDMTYPEGTCVPMVGGCQSLGSGLIA